MSHIGCYVFFFFCSSRRSRGSDPLLQQMALCYEPWYETSHHDTDAHGTVWTNPEPVITSELYGQLGYCSNYSCHAIRINGEDLQAAGALVLLRCWGWRLLIPSRYRLRCCNKKKSDSMIVHLYILQGNKKGTFSPLNVHAHNFSDSHKSSCIRNAPQCLLLMDTF